MAAAARKPSVSGPAAGASTYVAPKRTAIELDKMKYDLFQGIPKQSIVSMTNANGGEVYEGQVDAKNKRSGKGTLKWPNGNVYFGQWQESSMCGSGIFLYAHENDTYKGEFKDDKKHGTGRYEFSNGNFYEGSFAADKRHGRGRYSWTCGDSYEGEWSEGHMQGKGTTIYSNGNRYDGHFVDDRREGIGKLVCADGLCYEGQWLKNMRHGTGKLQFPNGDFYEGDWDNDKKHGHGTDAFANGNRFVGQYRDNVKHGQGQMTYANGDKYTGEWKSDKMDGQGTYEFSNGFVYEGTWASDVRHGQGKYTFPSGHVYIGEWRNDKRHGAGQLVMAPSGDVYKGTWADGKMHGSFTVERRSDWAEPSPGAPPSTVVLFKGPLRKVYEGLWEQGVPTKAGVYFIYQSASATQPCFTISGEWDASSATRKSDGTIEMPHADHWRAVALLSNLSVVGKKPNHLLAAMDGVFCGMSNRPLLDYYDAELQSYMPSVSMQQERMSRLKKFAEVLQRLDFANEVAHAEYQKRAASGVQDVDALTRAVETMEKDLAARQAKRASLQDELDAVDQEAAALREEEKHIKQRADSVAKQREELKTLKSQVNKLDSQVAAAEADVDSLRAKQQSLHDDEVPKARREWEALREEVDGTLAGAKATSDLALQAAKSELSDKEACLKAATKKATDASAKARDTKSALESAIQKLNAQAAVVQKQTADAEKQRAQKSKKLQDDAKKKAEQESSALQHAKSEVDRLQALLATTEASYAELQRKTEEAHRLVLDKDKSAAARNEALTELRDSNVTQTRALHEADAALQVLHEELVALRCRELELQRNSEAALQASRQAALAALEAKRRQQQTGYDILVSEVTSLDEQLCELKKRLAVLTEESETLKAAANDAEKAAQPSPVMQPSSPKKSKKRSDGGDTSSGRRASSFSASPVCSDDIGGSGSASQQPVVAGKLRRGSSMLLQQARQDDPDGSSGTSLRSNTNDYETIAELEKRVAAVRRQNDEDEVNVERLLREKKLLEDQIKDINDALTAKTVQQAAGMFGANLHSTTVSLDLTEAGKEAIRHQLIKARSKQSTLLKEQDKLRSLIAAVDQNVSDMRRQNQEGSQQSIASIIASLRPEDWRLSYLVEQIDAKGKQIAELEVQCSNVPLLEEQLQSFKETLSGLQSRQQAASGGMAASSRRPPPF